MSDDLSALDRVHQTHPDARYQITASGPWAGSPMIFTAELGKGFDLAEAEDSPRWTRPRPASEIGWVPILIFTIKGWSMTYGKSSGGKYAVARESNKVHGVWDACEIDGELYRVIDVQEIPECDWERTDALEEAAKSAEKKW